MLGVMRSYWTATISTVRFGISKIAISDRWREISRRTETRPLSPEQASLATVRRFQSETEALREVPEPFGARLAIVTLSSFLLVGLLFTFVTKLDRVVSSTGGKIVPVGQVNVF